MRGKPSVVPSSLDQYDILIYMKERFQRSFEEVYESLSEEQLAVCIYLSINYQDGIDEGFLIAMGLSKSTIEELVSFGIAQKGENHRFFQEYIDQNKGKYEAINSARDADLLNYELSDEDRELLNHYDRAERVLEIKNSKPRYRLYSQQFSDFVRSQAQPDEVKK